MRGKPFLASTASNAGNFHDGGAVFTAGALSEVVSSTTTSPGPRRSKRAATSRRAAPQPQAGEGEGRPRVDPAVPGIGHRPAAGTSQRGIPGSSAGLARGPGRRSQNGAAPRACREPRAAARQALSDCALVPARPVRPGRRRETELLGWGARIRRRTRRRPARRGARGQGSPASGSSRVSGWTNWFTVAETVDEARRRAGRRRPRARRRRSATRGSRAPSLTTTSTKTAEEDLRAENGYVATRDEKGSGGRGSRDQRHGAALAQKLPLAPGQQEWAERKREAGAGGMREAWMIAAPPQALEKGAGARRRPRTSQRMFPS